MLSGANTYTGTTTVSAGSLSIAGDGNLGGGALTLGAGTTLAVTGATTLAARGNAGSATVASLAGNGRVLVDFDSSFGQLTITGGLDGQRDLDVRRGTLNLGTVTPLSFTGQTLIIFGASVVLLLAMYVFFERTLAGKALRATSVNRTGARLMGISGDSAGSQTFTMAAFIGALSGLLIAPSTTIYYDTGFLIGLKGFVAAVFGGLGSFPMALSGAIGVGLIESFGSFWASAFKEVIVFTVILPVLLWRSFVDPHHEEH